MWARWPCKTILPGGREILLEWMHSNGRMSVLRSEMDTRQSEMNARLVDLNASLSRHIDDARDLLRAEFRRVEKVMEARLRHLEEHD